MVQQPPTLLFIWTLSLVAAVVLKLFQFLTAWTGPAAMFSPSKNQIAPLVLT